MCLSPRWLSPHQDAAEFRGPGASRTWRGSGNALVSPGLNDLRTSYSIHGLFCDGFLPAILGHLKALKRERLKSSPRVALITNGFGDGFCGEGTDDQR